ncbi:hypothetical protein [Micromonospora endolithica]|uniref:Uncharacterized protein n=1 Tax=Micromonospora endolithica TaxID=230091 RepID=A0A3A9Z3B2_9ACTN|nr:hypothetical protein [Micromonospora endolithica]RKN42758.1 hypothetical protein D7223_22245 [Micromonospora endolithica]TWJ25397.1 hypothetical protein JD76_05568 [Micromonospora endolithica]
MSFLRPDARKLAAVAALAAVALLVTLLVWRPGDLLGVGLALVVVLLAAVAGVAVAAARDRAGEEPPPGTAPADSGGLHGIDADTLETLDNRETLRAVRERRRGR